LPEATERLRNALERHRRVYAKEKYKDGHADLARSLNNLGGLLLSPGESANAEPFLRQALQRHQALDPKEKYPHGHPELAVSRNNLGGLLRDPGGSKKREADQEIRSAKESPRLEGD
jgi:Tetratricopeptide repeat